jgi:3-hydroxyisobutyrate dehydrogenase-like beta-hydroxyacid dehydrogenase
MSKRTKRNVGIIGLGIIGDRVREVLRRKGFHVFVWNRTPRTVPNFVGAPAELAEMCDFLQIFVSDDEALLHVARHLSPGLSARHVVLAHSTVAPHTMSAAAEIIERRGARFVEAPFTGSKEAAEKGELVYYVGGDNAAIQEARPILEASAKQIVQIGEIGQATAIKIATNIVTSASVQAAAEAMALLQAVGVSREKFAEAMQQNASNSTTLSMKLPKMIEGNFEPHFSVKHMFKDMQIANRLGLSHHLELGVTSAARDRLLEQMQRGHGDEDYSAIIRKYFPDIQPPGGEEMGLELFDARPVSAPPVEEAPVEEAPVSEASVEEAAVEEAPVEELAHEQPHNVIQSFPEVSEEPVAPPVTPMAAAPLASIEPAEEHPELSEAHKEEAASNVQEITEEESQHQRGFFRFLRRASN